MPQRPRPANANVRKAEWDNVLLRRTLSSGLASSLAASAAGSTSAAGSAAAGSVAGSAGAAVSFGGSELQE